MGEKKYIKEYKINLNYISFIKELIESKIEISNLNKGEIEKKYNNIVELKFNNLERVSNRDNRKEVLKVRNSYLESEKIDLKKYIEVDNKVKLLSREKKSRNYLIVE